MEALGVLKFWRNAAEVRSDVDDARSTAFVPDDGETDDEDELFDLVFRSPFHEAIIQEDDDASKKDMEFIESPGDVLLSKIEFSNSKQVSPVTILQSAQKFKVKFVLGFRKSSKCEKSEPNSVRKVCSLNQLSKLSKSSSDNSSPKCTTAGLSVASQKIVKGSSDFETSSRVVSSEKSIPKYLKLIKPFNIKVSKKVKLTDSMTPSPPPTASMNPPPRRFSEGSRLSSLKIVPRNLRKSRSASAAAALDLPSVRRSNDSLLQQHDGVQSAILHCKKSYSSSSQEFSQLFRSSSDPSHEDLNASGSNSGENQNRCSI